jgi:Flp pilus assembly CpaF family ATPase
MIRLSIRREGIEPRELEIAGDAAVLGKQADCDVVLDDARVSRRHARLHVEGGRVLVEDLGSTNGTDVAGERVDGPRVAAPADEIVIGPFSIWAKLAETVAAPVMPAADEDRTALAPPPPAPTPVAEAPVPPPAREASAAASPPDPALGPLGPLLADDAISEIMVNGPDEVFVERGGRLELTDVRFPSAEFLTGLVHRLAADGGRVIDERRPMVDAHLKDGSRLNAVLPPLSLRGPSITIRRFPKRRLGAEQLLAIGACDARMLAFLRMAVEGKMTMLVSGGTGSGKTTLLNALSAFVGADQRIVTIEDAAELRLPQRHVLPLETRPPDADGGGEVTIRDLVRNSLRMRPDRIIVGEVRGAEALDMLQAMNTGHEGSLSTIHANSPREALSRLETLILFAGTELPQRAVREQIVSAIRLIVQTARCVDGKRRVTSVAEISGMEGDQFTLGEIFRWDGAAFRATGYVPRCRDKLVERGFAPDNAWFQK